MSATSHHLGLTQPPECHIMFHSRLHHQTGLPTPLLNWDILWSPCSLRLRQSRGVYFQVCHPLPELTIDYQVSAWDNNGLYKNTISWLRPDVEGVEEGGEVCIAPILMIFSPPPCTVQWLYRAGVSVIVLSAGETALLGSSSLVITNNTVSCAELVISEVGDSTPTSLSVFRQSTSSDPNTTLPFLPSPHNKR